MLRKLNHIIAGLLIRDFDNTDDHSVRVRHGIVAAWTAITVSAALFTAKIILAINADSVAVFANAFHLLSDFANSVILLISFKLAGRPATSRTPFGYGRIEHLAPLIMAVVLFVSGINLGEKALHQIFNPHDLHYFPSLPWILGLTIIVKEFVGQFIRYLGTRIRSRAILTTASHHRVEAILSAAVIAGLITSRYLHLPQIDGFTGAMAALWLLFLGVEHGRHALVPLLGEAPSHKVTERIRTVARSVEGIEDVHEIIVHDYGSKYLISLHAEIPEKYGPAGMHDIAENCEEKLRREYRGEAVCHTDPLMENTEEVQKIEDAFREVVNNYEQVSAYHDFRVIDDSEDKVIVAADIDVSDEVSMDDFPSVGEELERQTKEAIPNVAYCSFYLTPKFAY